MTASSDGRGASVRARPSAVIFDMDGLLLDSEAIMRRCFHEVAHEVGITVAPGSFESLIGLNKVDGAALVAEIVAGRVDAGAFDAEVHARYDAAIADGVPLKPGVTALLDRLDDLGLPRAVATSTHGVRARRKLDASGLLERVGVVVSGHDVARGKPAPDVFLLAADRLAMPPARCAVFEDSPTGVRGAVAAGMTVVQVPDLVAPEPGIEALGVIVTQTLLEGAQAIGLT